MEICYVKLVILLLDILLQFSQSIGVECLAQGLLHVNSCVDLTSDLLDVIYKYE